MCRFHFSVGVWLVDKFKAYQSTILPVNMILIAVFYQILLFLGGHILLGGFNFGDEALDLYRVDAKYSG